MIEDNEIFANTNTGILIRSWGSPTVRANHIHNSKASGIHVNAHGQVVIGGNEIFSNTYNGIEITGGSNPTVRDNRINKNGYEAIAVWERGGGRFEENDLRDSPRGVWDIAKDCLPNFTRVGNLE